MASLEFQRLELRERSIYVPFEEAVPVKDHQEMNRMQVVGKLRNTLYDYWRNFASEHMKNVPVDASTAEMLPVFLSAYVLMLRRFRGLRRQSGLEVERYATSIRVIAYDKTLQTWKEIADLHRARFQREPQYSERLVTTALMVGLVGRELQFVGAGNMNAAEVIVQRQVQQRKAAAQRHAENRAMKKEVFDWLDANMARFESMDKAASEIFQKIVPVGFRAARDWVGEWNKLRSARTA